MRRDQRSGLTIVHEVVSIIAGLTTVAWVGHPAPRLTCPAEGARSRAAKAWRPSRPNDLNRMRSSPLLKTARPRPSKLMEPHPPARR